MNLWLPRPHSPYHFASSHHPLSRHSLQDRVDVLNVINSLFSVPSVHLNFCGEELVYYQ